MAGWHTGHRRGEGLGDLLDGDVEIPIIAPAEDRIAHDRKVKQTRALITTTIGEDFVKEICSHMLLKKPHLILASIKDPFRADDSLENHAILDNKANQITIKSDETIDEYIVRHKNV